MIKVYVVGGAVEYARFLSDYELTDDVKEANLVLFTGGEDVSPSLYGKKKYPNTYSNIKRDKAEKEIFDSLRPDQYCLGICRGSQFLCVMNGGILIQDLHGHALWGTHPIQSIANEQGNRVVYEITSTHHQAQYPFDLPSEDYGVLYTSEIIEDLHGSGVNSDIVYQYGLPEIVEYHKEGLPRCLAVQGHPEMIPNSPVAKRIDELVHALVSGNLKKVNNNYGIVK